MWFQKLCKIHILSRRYSPAPYESLGVKHLSHGMRANASGKLYQFTHYNLNKYGYIDKTGKTVLDAIYDWAEPFKSDITVVSINGKYKFIDRTGKEALKIKCQYMQPNFTALRQK